MRRLVPAAVVGILTAVVVAVIAAVFLAVADLYLSGHGIAEIRKPLVATGAMSLADILLLIASFGAGGVAGYAMWRAGPK